MILGFNAALRPRSFSIGGAMSMTTTTPDIRPLSSVTDLCALLRVSRAWFYEQTKQGLFPPPTHKVGRQHLWKRDVVVEWLRRKELMG
jgi:predicted DNA-binding transcriptional regulator AlpA